MPVRSRPHRPPSPGALGPPGPPPPGGRAHPRTGSGAASRPARPLPLLTVRHERGPTDRASARRPAGSARSGGLVEARERASDGGRARLRADDGAAVAARGRPVPPDRPKAANGSEEWTEERVPVAGRSPPPLRRGGGPDRGRAAASARAVAAADAACREHGYVRRTLGKPKLEKAERPTGSRFPGFAEPRGPAVGPPAALAVAFPEPAALGRTGDEDHPLAGDDRASSPSVVASVAIDASPAAATPFSSNAFPRALRPPVGVESERRGRHAAELGLDGGDRGQCPTGWCGSAGLRGGPGWSGRRGGRADGVGPHDAGEGFRGHGAPRDGPLVAGLERSAMGPPSLRGPWRTRRSA